MEIIADILKNLASLGTSESVACAKFWFDEPEMPKSMIEKI